MMRAVLLGVMIVMVSTSAWASEKLIDVGLDAYISGDNVKAVELFGKACDGGSAEGCKGYRILNEQGH